MKGYSIPSWDPHQRVIPARIASFALSKYSLRMLNNLKGLGVIVSFFLGTLTGLAQPMVPPDKQTEFDFTNQQAIIVFNWFEKEFNYVVVAPPALNNERVTLRSAKRLDVNQIYDMLVTLLMEKGYYPVLNSRQRVLEVFPLAELNKAKLRQLVDPKPETLGDGEEIVVARITIDRGNAQAVRTYLNSRMKLPKWVTMEADASQRNLEIVASVKWLKQMLQEVKQSGEALSTTIQGVSVRQFNLKFVSARFAFQMLVDLLKLKEGAEARTGPPPPPGSPESASANWIAGKTSLADANLPGAEQTRWPSASGTVGTIQYQLYLDDAANAIQGVAPQAILLLVDQFLQQLDVEPLDRSRTPFLPQFRVFSLNYLNVEAGMDLLFSFFQSLYQEVGTATKTGPTEEATLIDEPPRSNQSVPPSSPTPPTPPRPTPYPPTPRPTPYPIPPRPTPYSPTPPTESDPPRSRLIGPIAQLQRGDWILTRTLPGRISFIANAASNNVMALAQQRDLDLVSKILEQNDRPSGQVLIEISVMEVALTDDYQFGIGNRIKSQLLSGQQTGGNPIGMEGKLLESFDLDFHPAESASEANFFLLSSDHLDTLLRMLSKQTKITVVSVPKVIAQNNKMAEINVSDTTQWIRVDKYQSAPATFNPDGSLKTPAQEATIESYQKLFTGLFLNVTPKINEQNEVFLDIFIELSEISGPPIRFGAPPPTNERTVKVSANVRHGETIVIGGLVKNVKTRTELRTPLLSAIPLIGNLFSSTTDSDAKRELVLFLTPFVAKGTGDAQKLMEFERARHPIMEWPAPKE